MAFVARPRVLLIDELSLGLAPLIVGQLLPIIQRLAASGVAVVLVEQSVNVALTVAERAYFMERGTIRFSGPTADLLARPDLLRSVFLQRATRDDAPRTVRATATRTVPTQPVALAVDGLVRRFGGIRAVDGATFDVHEREIVGMIGPNGAGKTTIFDLVSGFLPLDDGRIVLAGHDITHASRRPACGGRPRAQLPGRAAVPRHDRRGDAQGRPGALGRGRAACSPRRCGCRRCSTTRSAARCAPTELLELMDLERFRTSFVRELSTGTRRILDLACQIAHRPTVILLDEPSSGIAQREVEALAPVLMRLRDEMGAALVVIEHDIPLVTEISDRLVALDMGRVIATGDPADVIVHPQVVESYLGTSSAAISRSGTRG